MAEPTLRIDVAYALPRQQWLRSVELPAGSHAIEAVRASGLVEMRPELTGIELDLGIFSSRVDSGHILQDGDRVEIYRPLQCDPMRARRLRAGR